ncbi:MAG: acetylxylan esterase [Pirellulales bacterium]|nr:acetylxylan esterase [Pirellulales bacterium]
MWWKILACVWVVIFGSIVAKASAQPADTIFDEAQVPAYVLPDPLVMEDGRKIESAEDWTTLRRPEILRLFEEHVHGRGPVAPDRIEYTVTSTDTNVLDGMATMKQVTIYVTGKRDGPSIDLLLYIPKTAQKPVPAFLGLNFFGNHTVDASPKIKLSESWMRSSEEKGIVNHQATEASRGTSASRWPVKKIVARGYALATIYYGDIEPDYPEGWQFGIRTAFDTKDKTAGYGPSRWGTIGVWAWGLSRAMDYLEQDGAIDSKRVAVMGHSRLGKTALWAGAQDPRFAIVISNNSGEGGASIIRRRFGEALHHSVTQFPYWYHPRYRDYAKRENALPVDAHMMIALMAPRPVYVASATEDRWADPHGEFLAARHAGPVYHLFGLSGVGVDQMPPPDQSVGDLVGYHVRSGKHDVTDFDWEQYLNFADRHYP